MTLRRAGATALAATVVGARVPGDPGGAGRACCCAARSLPHRTSALIRRHGIALWLRRLPVFPRPPHTPQEGLR